MCISIKQAYPSIWLGSLIWLLSHFLAAEAAENNPYNIELKFKQTGMQRLALSVCVSSTSEMPETLKYVLIIKKEQNIITRQRGNLSLKPEEKRCDFSKAAVTIRQGEVLTARFWLYGKGKLLGEASTFYPADI